MSRTPCVNVIKTVGICLNHSGTPQWITLQMDKCLFQTSHHFTTIRQVNLHYFSTPNKELYDFIKVKFYCLRALADCK